MSFLSILLYSSLIFLGIFIPWAFYRYFKVRKITNMINLQKLSDWKIIPVPENESYVITTGKELKPKDIIIHVGLRFEILACGIGKGAESFEFGSYFWIEGKFINSHPLDNNPIKGFWIFENSPIIRCLT